MSMSDPIADMLTRLRNGLMARHDEVELPSSKMKQAIAKVMVEEGYLESFQVIEDKKQNILRIQLKYRANTPVIEGLKRISKPSRRVYVGHDQIPRVLSGLGVNVMSTPRGVMSDRAAREQKLGGEVLCAVW